jgi:superfamily II DNA or RNA helicase
VKPSHPKAKILAQRGFFRGITTFSEFERRTSAEPTTTARGDAFEVLVEAFLYTEPTYAARMVWPVGQIPLAVRNIVGVPPGPKGIDGVYQDRNGDYVPYQAKFRSENEPSFKDTSSFFRITERWRGQRLLLTNQATVDKDARTRCASLLRHHFEQHLTPARFLEIENWLEGSLTRPSALPPLPHQKASLISISDELSRANRATAVMACGTGKTLVSVWAAEAQNPKTVLVLVPSLSLMTQTVPEWCQQSKWRNALQFICVCSDKSVITGEDSADVHPGEAGFLVTTDSKKIREFLERKTDSTRVVFSTYQSAEEVARGMPKGFQFDLGIFDEAHKTTGHAGGLFSFALWDKNLRIKKRLFFTATPRHYDIRKNKDGDFRSYASMDDERAYGKVAYRLSFKQAVKDKIICPYQIVISVINAAQLDNKLLKKASVLVKRRKKHAEDVAKQLALVAAAKRTSAKRMISFHGGIRRAEEFKDGVSDHLQGYELFHVSGQQRSGDRAVTMRDFASCEKALITNARCLTEGVNVPTVDLVAFIDPRQSRIDIAQAAGRAMRRPRNYSKKFGYIVVPLFLERRRGEAIEKALKRSGFESVATVIAAMQEQDEDLVDVIRQIREDDGAGVNGRGRERLGEKVAVIGAELDLSTLRKAVQAQLVERLGESWDYMYGVLLAWRRVNPRQVPPVEEVFKKVKLGVWVATQRANFLRGKLRQDRLEKLNALEGWFWDWERFLWQRGLHESRVFSKCHGHLVVPRRSVTKSGFQLDVWIRSVRQRKKKRQLSDAEIQEVQAIPGWRWEPLEEVWHETYKKVQVECAKKSLQEIEQSRNSSGIWIVQQKSRYSAMHGTTKVVRRPLSSEQISLLEALPGWSWDRRRDSWLAHFEALVAYKAANNGQLPPSTSKTLEFRGLRIVGWMNKQRSRMDIRDEWQLTLLRQKIPELLEKPFERRWREAFATLQDFAKKTKNTYIAQNLRWKGFALGSWVSHQRAKYRERKLTKEQIRLLQSVLGWTWDASSMSASGLSKQGISPAKARAGRVLPIRHKASR